MKGLSLAIQDLYVWINLEKNRTKNEQKLEKKTIFGEIYRSAPWQRLILNKAPALETDFQRSP
jgi:hypothetical protein